jgi:tetratricopeptide (TPR) repeat protein
MVSTRFRRRRLWIIIGMVVSAGWMVSGCAKTPPGPRVADVNQRLDELGACMTRSQQVVQAALDAGVTAVDMASASGRLSEAQKALDEARQLLQEGKNGEAMDRVTRALDDCNQIEAMALQARDQALERELAQTRHQVETRMGQVTPCIDAARQAIQSAQAAGATVAELAAAKSALASAEEALQEAQALLARGDTERTRNRLEVAQSECLAARDLGNQAGMIAAARMSARPDRYTVTRGDTL